MRILVTGAAGFIASNLIPRLLERGDEVAGADNFFLGKRAYVHQHPRFAFHEFDLLELDRVIALDGDFRPDRIWHLAANSDISYGTKYTDFDLKGGTLVTYNVLEAMRRTGVKEIVFSSSGAVYGEPTVMPTPEDYGPILPISLYAASKVACETLITAFAHNYDLTAWIYRFGNIVGPNPTHGVIHDFVLRLREDPTKLVVLGDGTQAKPYVYVEDCLDGMEFGIAHAQRARERAQPRRRRSDLGTRDHRLDDRGHGHRPVGDRRAVRRQPARLARRRAAGEARHAAHDRARLAAEAFQPRGGAADDRGDRGAVPRTDALS